jgi:flavin reductase (DIM6/NTAB) family NADH-FMN oxidoreductase RutF
MPKITLHPDRYMFPRPTLLLGANVDGKPNFMAAGGGGVANGKPPMISVPIQHHRYTLEGIMQNKTFSVNTPSVEQLKEVDYCGIVSGKDADKVDVCGFKVFYGDLKTAPLIEQFPLNLECRVMHILNLGSHALVIGQVEGSYISEGCLTDGKPDVEKIRPAIFNLEASSYLAFGGVVAKAYSIGRELIKAKQR